MRGEDLTSLAWLPVYGLVKAVKARKFRCTVYYKDARAALAIAAAAHFGYAALIVIGAVLCVF